MSFPIRRYNIIYATDIASWNNQQNTFRSHTITLKVVSILSNYCLQYIVCFILKQVNTWRRSLNNPKVQLPTLKSAKSAIYPSFCTHSLIYTPDSLFAYWSTYRPMHPSSTCFYSSLPMPCVCAFVFRLSTVYILHGKCLTKHWFLCCGVLLIFVSSVSDAQFDTGSGRMLRQSARRKLTNVD
jgi:hypothetical protein